MCWPAAMQASRLQKSYFFHRNDMLGTLVFTSSEYWAPCSFSRAQSYVLMWWYYFLICFVSYSWLMRTLSYSKWVQKKLTKDKTELNHNIQWCPLTNLRQSFIHNYDNTIRQYHKQQLTRASQCFRKTKIQSSRASFILFWQSKQKWHHFRTWWKMKINN